MDNTLFKKAIIVSFERSPKTNNIMSMPKMMGGFAVYIETEEKDFDSS